MFKRIFLMAFGMNVGTWIVLAQLLGMENCQVLMIENLMGSCFYFSASEPMFDILVAGAKSTV